MKAKPFTRLLLCWLLAMAYSRLVAQHYSFQTYSQNEGLSSYNPEKIVQDKYGFLWVGTQEGLNRFDGRNFLILKKAPGSAQGLSENFVVDCKTDASGNLWVATSFGGIDVVDPTSLRIVKRMYADSSGKRGPLSNWIRSLLWADKNNFWIGTYYGISIYDKNRNSFRTITGSPLTGQQPLNANYLGLDGHGQVIAGVENYGILVFTAATQQPIGSFTKAQLGFDEHQSFKLLNTYPLGRDSLLLCTSQGVRLLVWENNAYSAQKTPPPIYAFLEKKEVRCIEQRKPTEIFVGTNQGLCVLTARGKNVEWVHSEQQIKNSLLDNDVQNFFTDSFGNFWIVTRKGLNRLERKPYAFTVYNRDPRSGDLLEHVNTIFPYSDSVLFASCPAGFYSVHLPTGAHRPILSADQYGFIWDVLKLRAGEYILSGEKELVLLNTQSWPYKASPITNFFPELQPVRFNYFNAMVPVGDSLVLFGSEEEKGLFVWNRRTKTVKHFVKQAGKPQGIFSNHIQNIRKDHRNNVWIISDESLSLFDPQSETFKHHFPQPGKKGKLNSYFLFDLYDDGHSLWITSYGGGINRFDPATQTFTALTEKNGLSSNCTYSVLPENDSLLWVSSNNGVNRINTKRQTVDAFYFTDGLQSSAFDTKSGCKFGNNLFFGGVDGFTRITRAGDPPPLARFPVYLSGVEYYEGKEVKKSEGLLPPDLQLGPGVNFLSFLITSLGFANSHNYTYQYRLEGITADWVPLGNRNYVTLAGLAPGDYRLKVRAQAGKGGWNESGWLTLVLRPYWYQTIYPKIALVALAFGLLFLFYRYRIAQLKKQHEIRRDIASDLHDDIGSTLNAVKMFTHLAQTDSANQSHLQKIETFLTDATAGLRDMIWVLDNSDDTVQELFERLKKFAVPATAAKGIVLDYTTQFDEKEAKLTKTEKRNLLLIAKETVNNAIKHSGCKHIDIHISQLKHKLRLCISDDGRGFVPATDGEGNGLRNLERRAQQINYRLAMNSAPDKGTQLVVEKV